MTKISAAGAHACLALLCALQSYSLTGGMALLVLVLSVAQLALSTIAALEAVEDWLRK